MNADMSPLTGAYAVDALTGTERDEFEQHMAGCEHCTREVDELRETAAKLGADATTAPPEALKKRVLDEITRTRQEPPLTGNEPPRNVRALPTRPWVTRLAVAAAAVGIALAGAFGGITWQSQQQLAELTERVQQAEQSSGDMTRLLRASDARIVQTSLGGGQASTVLSRQLGKAMFVSSGAPAPPPGRVYQLWLIGEAGPTSAGVFASDTDGETPVMTAFPPDTAQMAVTVEPEGGSAQPTTDPIAVMNVAA